MSEIADGYFIALLTRFFIARDVPDSVSLPQELALRTKVSTCSVLAGYGHFVVYAFRINFVGGFLGISTPFSREYYYIHGSVEV